MGSTYTGEPLTVFITGEVNEAQMAQIRAAAPDATVRYFASQGELEARIEDAAVVAGHVSPAALARAARLRWVQSWAAGPDRLLYPEMIPSPVICTSCKGNGAVPLAEHAMMLMLMLNRDTRRWLRAQDEHRWDHWSHPELNGRTCGIIGLGYSGQDLALNAKRFTCACSACVARRSRRRTWTKCFRRSGCPHYSRHRISLSSPRHVRPKRSGCLARRSFAL